MTGPTSPRGLSSPIHRIARSRLSLHLRFRVSPCPARSAVACLASFSLRRPRALLAQPVARAANTHLVPRLRPRARTRALSQPVPARPHAAPVTPLALLGLGLFRSSHRHCQRHGCRPGYPRYGLQMPPRYAPRTLVPRPFCCARSIGSRPIQSSYSVSCSTHSDSSLYRGVQFSGRCRASKAPAKRCAFSPGCSES